MRDYGVMLDGRILGLRALWKAYSREVFLENFRATFPSIHTILLLRRE